MNNKEWEELWKKLDAGLKGFAEKYRNNPDWDDIKQKTKELIANRVDNALSGRTDSPRRTRR